MSFYLAHGSLKASVTSKLTRILNTPGSRQLTDISNKNPPRRLFAIVVFETYISFIFEGNPFAHRFVVICSRAARAWRDFLGRKRTVDTRLKLFLVSSVAAGDRTPRVNARGWQTNQRRD